MKEIHTNLFKHISVACLVPGVPLLVATLFCGVLWLRSYFIYDYMARWNYRTIDSAWVVDHIHLNSGKGGVNLSSARETPTSERERQHIQEHAGVETYWRTNPKTHYPTLRKLKGRWGELGFYSGPVLSNHSASGTRTGHEILMPWWCPTLVLVLFSSMLTTPYILYFRRKRTSLSNSVSNT